MGGSGFSKSFIVAHKINEMNNGKYGKGKMKLGGGGYGGLKGEAVIINTFINIK